MSQRNIVYDLMKGLALILMMLCHLVYTDGPVKQFIYSFHMPLFFILAGVFAKDMVLFDCGRIGHAGATYKAIEYCGSTIRGLEMDELMSEIEAIVATGTKLNLDYYIRQEVDDEVVEEILDYFKEEATSDSLQDAIAALEPDCEEMEIRLARIKFLCEIAS